MALSEQQACWAVALSDQQTRGGPLPEQQPRGGPLPAVPAWLPVPPEMTAPAPPCGQLPPDQR